MVPVSRHGVPHHTGEGFATVTTSFALPCCDGSYPLGQEGRVPKPTAGNPHSAPPPPTGTNPAVQPMRGGSWAPHSPLHSGRSSRHLLHPAARHRCCCGGQEPADLGPQSSSLGAPAGPKGLWAESEGRAVAYHRCLSPQSQAGGQLLLDPRPSEQRGQGSSDVP